MYEYWCKRGKVLRPARKKVQAKSGALGFQYMRESRKHGKAGVTQWLEKIKVELPKMHLEKYGKQLPEITPEVLQEVSTLASAVFMEALLNTRNRNCFLNPFMRQAKCLNPRSADWVLVWAAMHDERNDLYSR